MIEDRQEINRALVLMTPYELALIRDLCRAILLHREEYHGR